MYGTQGIHRLHFSFCPEKATVMKAAISSAMRQEILRNVKSILVKHVVNLRHIRFSCPNDILSLYGRLEKDPAGEFDTVGVESLCRELKNLPHIHSLQFRIENWYIDAGLTSIKKVARCEDS